MKSYSEKLRSVEWQKKRLEIMQRDEWKCTKCNAATFLNVHHTEYIKGFNPWEYEDSCLITLCEECHKKEHGLSQRLELEGKYEHLIIRREEPKSVILIKEQIQNLTEKLKEKVDFSIIEERLKSIMFLKTKLKELGVK